MDLERLDDLIFTYGVYFCVTVLVFVFIFGKRKK